MIEDMFAIGDRVFHQKFGDGNVTAIDGHKLTVDFDKVGSKSVIGSFVAAAASESAPSALLAETEPQPSAEIIPFPISRTESGRFIAAEYARRPERGRYNKQAYAEGVITTNIERLQRLGVAPSRIDAEVASLESIFAALTLQMASA